MFPIFLSLQFSGVSKTQLPFKRILALPSLTQICIVTVLQPFTLDNFQLDNPVIQDLQTIGVQFSYL